MARQSHIYSRIETVLETGVRSSPLTRRAAALAVVVVLAAVLPVAALQNNAEDERVYNISADIVPPCPIEKHEPAHT